MTIVVLETRDATQENVDEDVAKEKTLVMRKAFPQGANPVVVIDGLSKAYAVPGSSLHCLLLLPLVPCPLSHFNLLSIPVFQFSPLFSPFTLAYVLSNRRQTFQGGEWSLASH